MGLYLSQKLLPYFVAVAKNDDETIWTDVNGSSKMFNVFFEDDDCEILLIDFKSDVSFLVRIDDGRFLSVSFRDPSSTHFDISDIVKNLVNDNAEVVA